MDDLRVNRSLVIPGDELRLSFSTSGGPGGQHANKVATRAEIAWNVVSSRALGPRQRNRVLMSLRNRIDSTGTLRLTSNRYRSQFRNREDVRDRLAHLVADALRQPKARHVTVPPAASKERRLADKKRRSKLKRQRGRPAPDDM